MDVRGPMGVCRWLVGFILEPVVSGCGRCGEMWVGGWMDGWLTGRVGGSPDRCEWMDGCVRAAREVYECEPAMGRCGWILGDVERWADEWMAW